MGKILYIDTTDNRKISISVINNNNKLTAQAKTGVLKAQVVLPVIERLLRKNGFKLSELTAVRVNIGPGSFTGIRVGLSVANALAYALGLKVNGKSQETKISYT